MPHQAGRQVRHLQETPDARPTENEADMKISDVMTTGVECLRPADSITRAADRMRELDVGSLPVCGDEDKLVGMITDRDITIRATASACDANATPVRDVMTPNIVYCFEDQNVEDAAKLMEEKQIRRLVVLNRNKRLVESFLWATWR
jgi:CBS domain-containing protein